MKKVLFMVCSVAIMFVACKKSTVADTAAVGEICVGPANEVVKSMVEGTTFPTSDDFRVFAYFNEELEANTDVSGAFNVCFIDDRDFTFNTGGIWYGGSAGSHNPYFWPKSGSLVFAGYHGTANVSYVPADGTQTMTIADYVASYKAKSEGTMNDLMYFPVTDKSYNNKGLQTPVEVAFYHALSWLTLQVVANELADSLFRIDSIKINNVNPKGNATVTGTQSSSEIAWVTNGTAAVIEQFKGKGGIIPSEADSVVVAYGEPQVIGDDYIFIPQTLEGITLTVSYSQLATGVGEKGQWVKMKDKVVALKGLKDTTTPTPVEINDWKAAKHYIYTIAFNFDEKDEILISPSVVEWETVNMADIEI